MNHAELRSLAALVAATEHKLHETAEALAIAGAFDAMSAVYGCCRVLAAVNRDLTYAALDEEETIRGQLRFEEPIGEAPTEDVPF